MQAREQHGSTHRFCHWLLTVNLAAFACDAGSTASSEPKAVDAASDQHEETDTDALPDAHAVEPDAEGSTTCATLASVCHDFDLGTGDLGDLCHDVGHEGVTSDCDSMYDECVAFCLGE